MFKGGRGWFDGVQAGYHHQCSSYDAAYSTAGAQMAKTTQESDLRYCHHGS